MRRRISQTLKGLVLGTSVVLFIALTCAHIRSYWVWDHVLLAKEEPRASVGARNPQGPEMLLLLVTLQPPPRQYRGIDVARGRVMVQVGPSPWRPLVVD